MHLVRSAAEGDEQRIVLRREQVVTILDMSPEHNPEWFSCEYRAWYTRLLTPLVRHIIVISDYTRQTLIALAGCSKLKGSLPADWTLVMGRGKGASAAFAEEPRYRNCFVCCLRVPAESCPNEL